MCRVADTGLSQRRASIRLDEGPAGGTREWADRKDAEGVIKLGCAVKSYNLEKLDFVRKDVCTHTLKSVG